MLNLEYFLCKIQNWHHKMFNTFAQAKQALDHHTSARNSKICRNAKICSCPFMHLSHNLITTILTKFSVACRSMLKMYHSGPNMFFYVVSWVFFFANDLTELVHYSVVMKLTVNKSSL